MTINAIIKQAIQRLKAENKLLTPDVYLEAFCKEAKKAGIIIDDCNQVDKYAKTLNKNYQEELKQYHLRSEQELIRYLISKLNRLNPSNCTTMLESTNLLVLRILDVVEVLHNKEISKLAKQTKELFKRPNISKEQFNTFRQYWINFLTIYDDTFLQKLRPITKIIKSDLSQMINNIQLDKFAKKEIDFKAISSLMIASLMPSIASSVNDKIANVSQTLRDNPEMITSKSVQNDIAAAIKTRILLDKNNLQLMVQSLDNILDKLSMQLIGIIEQSDQSNFDIKAIKHELENYNHKKEIDFKTAHQKLYTIAIALEESTASLSKTAQIQNTQAKALSKKIENLENELKDAKKEAQYDFLTKLYNKRALDNFLKIKESEFDRYERNYSIVMFDIDHFKKVNDTYGHEAGDIILVSFAKILKDASRTVDVIGRFGGEEFMAILTQTDLSNANKFAQKVVSHVRGAKFIYKDQRIDLTVSAGVAQRVSFASQAQTINSADEYLYLAKNNGRNRVESS